MRIAGENEQVLAIDAFSTFYRVYLYTTFRPLGHGF